MTSLITGINGFAGRHLAHHLAERGDDVAGIVHRAEPPPTDQLASIRLATADIRDQDALARILADTQPQTVYHLAAAANVSHVERAPDDAYDVNVNGSLHLFEAVRRAAPGCRIVFVSTGSAYGAAAEPGLPITEDRPLLPMTSYATSKMCCELLAREYAETYGLSVVIARSFNHTGPGQEPFYVCSEFARKVAEVARGKRKAAMTTGDLELTRDFTDVRDVVRAYRLLAASDTRETAYNVCSGRGRSLRAILDLLRSWCDVEIEVVTDEDRFRGSDSATVIGDPSRIGNELGWRAEIPFEQTMRELYDWWLERV